MKRFKELRMTIIMMIFLITALVVAFMRLMAGERLSVMILMGIALILSMMNAFSNTMMIDDDFALIYEFKYGLILPSIIDLHDIQSVRMINRFKAEIIHKKRSVVYLFSAEKFVETLKQSLLKETEERGN
ncbi:MAG: hypothetical protein J6P61_00395 [Erysipelotrichaceae bacterium]|nr:hypothetical protein [Erysipelotrichaceae bacterium]